jgi:hypothetical protein
MSRFTICKPSWNFEGRVLTLGFEGDVFGAFQETVTFPQFVGAESIDRALLDRLGALAALAMGTSYYKAAPATMIEVDFGLTAQARDMALKLYGPGLGEFYVRNELDYPPEFDLVAEDADQVDHVTTPKGRTAVCAFGGGKDSHVASAILTAAGIEATRVSVILSEQVGERLQSMSEMPVNSIQRRIDPKLIALSREGKALNGHIPITAINSVILGIYAVMHRLDYVVFANERAASEPTLQANGHPVNHQYSKSLEFEDTLRGAFAAAGAPFEYFSILRPVSELWTGHYLAKRAEFALEIFASCNRNFVFAGPSVLEPDQRWCGECAKCVYTSVLLAPFLSPDHHAAVFQSQPLHNLDNLEFLREIAGLTDAKPWECVGERREVASALVHLFDDHAWIGAPLVASIKDELSTSWNIDELKQAWDGALDARSEHRIPSQIANVMNA